MLDHRAFLRDASEVIARLQRRGIPQTDIDQLALLAKQRCETIQTAEALRRQLNEASAAMQQIARSGDTGGVDATRSQLKNLKAAIKTADEAQQQAEARLEELLLGVPNLPQSEVPDGPDASHNRIERVVGDPPTFSFAPKPHWELAERLGILDFERARKLSGARFAVYLGDGARLERALINFMLDQARANGFEEVLTPVLVRREAMVAAAQYPKFEGESFETLDHEFALIPTSEVTLVNLRRDEIIETTHLPVRYTAFTPCFRREAGAAGKDTRGLIRLHQFNKVELVAFTTPEGSNAELERITGCAEGLLQKLGLAYRVISLCTGDLGFASSKTYDLEVWLPSQDCYREISSCSNCTDFQARRGKIRYRPDGGDGGGDGDKQKTKPQLVHTLNGSALAVGRTVVAILENYQQPDGSIRIPDALVPYFGATAIGH